MIKTTKDRVQKAANLLGGEYIAILEHSKDKPNIIHNYSDEWIERYLEKDYWKIDPALDAPHSSQISLWGENVNDSKVISEAREFSIISGISFDIFSIERKKYTVTISSDQNLKSFEKNFDFNQMSTILNMSTYIHSLSDQQLPGIDNFLKSLEKSLENKKHLDKMLKETYSALGNLRAEIDYNIPYRFTPDLAFLTEYATASLKNPLSIRNLDDPLEDDLEE